MALIKWYDVSAAGDCLENAATWNDMIDYIKHSACTDFTIYSTCTSGGQAFRFTQAGSNSMILGRLASGGSLEIRANDGETTSRIKLHGGGDIWLDSGDDVFFKENGVERFKFYDGKSIDFLGDRAIHIDDDETYIGHGAGDNIGAGTSNTLVGHDAGQANDFSNCALFGYEAGKNNTQDDIVAIGYQALIANTGLHNTAVGTSALGANTTGYQNVAIGYHAMLVETASWDCVVIGHNAGVSLTNGYDNTIVGSRAGGLLTDGFSNIFVGHLSGYETSSGQYNVAIGTKSLYDNLTTHYNTAVGTSAGENAEKTACAYFGYNAGKNNATDNVLFINNSDSAFPLIWGDFANDVVKFGDNNALFFFKFSHDANDAIVETEANNRSIYLKPHGTGLVKFGTYATKGAEAFAGFITMEDAGGTARKMMICA